MGTIRNVAIATEKRTEGVHGQLHPRSANTASLAGLKPARQAATLASDRQRVYCSAPDLCKPIPPMLTARADGYDTT